MTAQRRDISDPEVIHAFAMEVRDLVHLDYLYVLTVADINATNHTLWNNWRAMLLRQLYMETKRALRRGLENPINKEDRIEQVQHEAMLLLARQRIPEQKVREHWALLGDDYFLREDAHNIAWHTRAILEHGDDPLPLVLIRKTSYRVFEGATEIFIYQRGSAHPVPGHGGGDGPAAPQHPGRPHHPHRPRPQPQHLHRADGGQPAAVGKPRIPGQDPAPPDRGAG